MITIKQKTLPKWKTCFHIAACLPDAERLHCSSAKWPFRVKRPNASSRLIRVAKAIARDCLNLGTRWSDRRKGPDPVYLYKWSAVFACPIYCVYKKRRLSLSQLESVQGGVAVAIIYALKSVAEVLLHLYVSLSLFVSPSLWPSAKKLFSSHIFREMTPAPYFFASYRRIDWTVDQTPLINALIGI